MTATDLQTLIAEALAKHTYDRAGGCLGCDWEVTNISSSWAGHHVVHQAAVIAALPRIAVVTVPTVDSGSLPAPAPSVSTDRRSAKEILDDFPR